MFGIKYPVICGAMMWLCKPKLCAAVSNAGGMGNLTAGNYPNEEEFRAAIKETRKLTDKPFMVNVTILPSVHITAEHHKMYLRVCAEEKVAGVEISGTPLDKAVGMEFIEKLKKAGVKMFHKVGSVRHAVHAEKTGYDGIYAAGIEEGGHLVDTDHVQEAIDRSPQVLDAGAGLRRDHVDGKALTEQLAHHPQPLLGAGQVDLVGDQQRLDVVEGGIIRLGRRLTDEHGLGLLQPFEHRLGSEGAVIVAEIDRQQGGVGRADHAR